MSYRLFAEQAERQILGGVLFQGEAIDDVIRIRDRHTEEAAGLSIGLLAPFRIR